ncbi:MAG: acetyl-CoA carboxylase, carboxyltransferase subunit beta [Alkalispirochaetaceae bacterium]
MDDRSFLEKKHSCPSCQHHIEEADLARNLFVCPQCSYHFRINAWERIRFLLDNGEFHEFSANLQTLNPIDFPGYDDRIRQAREKSSLDEAVTIGTGSILSREAVLAIMSFQFLGGSMGSVVGEKVARAILHAVDRELPCILFAASGGARMQEGIYSLMQMAKTSHAIALLGKARLPLFVVLTDPTTGGVTASFAMLGDVTLAEPGALIGFAGPRVIEGTIKQKLPPGFQRSEFQMDKGFVDAVVPRSELKSTLAFLIDTHTKGIRR